MYVLGVDIGTSSLKGILVNREGQVVTTAQSDYPLHLPQPGYSEQDPKLWTKALNIVMKDILTAYPDAKSTLAGISFSGQMHSLVLLDEAKEPLRNAILWNDVRTTAQCQTILEKYPEVVDQTKNVPLEGFTLPKILWVQENEPEIWAKAKHFLLPKDYVGFYLTGNQHMDYSDAAGTLMLDVLNKDWSDEIATIFKIPQGLYPKLVDSTGFIGHILPELKDMFGFTQDVPVFAGGADNAMAAIGAGIVENGVAMASIGTSGVFLAYEERHNGYNGKIHYFNSGIKDAFYSMGVTLSAGQSLQWFKETFAQGESFEGLLAGIDQLENGSLLYTPYIAGERTPHPDSKIRGSFIGIDASHTKKHFAKAVMEGITFSLKDSMSIMEGEGLTFNKLVSVGGGAKNPDWLQMQADIFNLPVTVLTTEQGPGLGAAIVAAVGAGWYDSVRACMPDFVAYQGVTQPIPANVEKYAKTYALYKQVYGATKAICHGIAR